MKAGAAQKFQRFRSSNRHTILATIQFTGNDQPDETARNERRKSGSHSRPTPEICRIQLGRIRHQAGGHPHAGTGQVQSRRLVLLALGEEWLLQ
jgi:hypothetical protein